MQRALQVLALMFAGDEGKPTRSESMGYMLSKSLQNMAKDQACNDSALLELLQIVSINFERGSATGDMLRECITELEDAVNTVDTPTAEDLRELSRHRESQFEMSNEWIRGVCGMRPV